MIHKKAMGCKQCFTSPYQWRIVQNIIRMKAKLQIICLERFAGVCTIDVGLYSYLYVISGTIKIDEIHEYNRYVHVTSS